MKEKPRVLLLVDWFWPGYRAGGPIQSCYNLVKGLGEFIDFSVITRDRDLGMDNPYPEITPGKWEIIDKDIRIFYARPDLTFTQLKRIIKAENFSVLSVNSLFSRKFTQWPLRIGLADKSRTYQIILSPRGMLAQGALSLKPVKKRIYLIAFRLLGIHKKLTWHATSAHEKTDILQAFGSLVKIVVAPNIPGDSPGFQSKLSKISQEAKFISVARVSPVKNTIAIIRAFNQIQGAVSLAFLGPVEDYSYFESCRKECEKLPLNVKVEWLGEGHPEIVKKILKAHHFFISATLGENFGHAIFEALSMGKPVIISDRTQWKGLEVNKTGFDLPLENPEKWKSTIQFCVDMNDSVYQEYSSAAEKFAGLFSKDAELVQKNLNLFGGF